MNLEHATPELFAALAKMQGEVENATKASINPHFKSRYADLAEVLNTVRPALAANGLAVIQSPSWDGQQCHVETALTHSSGGRAITRMSCVPAKQDAQGIGAATTYLRRYSLAAICGVAQEDDDGNEAAHGRGAQRNEQRSEPRQMKQNPFAAALPTIAPPAEEPELITGIFKILWVTSHETTVKGKPAKKITIEAEGPDGVTQFITLDEAVEKQAAFLRGSNTVVTYAVNSGGVKFAKSIEAKLI